MDISNIALAELKSLIAQIPKEIERREKEEKIKAISHELALQLKSKLLDNEKIAKSNLVEGNVTEIPLQENHPFIKISSDEFCRTDYKHSGDATLAWTGRGRQPKWVVAFLANGGTLEQLAV